MRAGASFDIGGVHELVIFQKFQPLMTLGPAIYGARNMQINLQGVCCKRSRLNKTAQDIVRGLCYLAFRQPTLHWGGEALSQARSVSYSRIVATT